MRPVSDPDQQQPARPPWRHLPADVGRDDEDPGSDHRADDQRDRRQRTDAANELGWRAWSRAAPGWEWPWSSVSRGRRRVCGVEAAGTRRRCLLRARQTPARCLSAPSTRFPPPSPPRPPPPGPAAARPFITLAAPSIIPIVPLMAWIGSLPARMVSSTVSVILARMPPGPGPLGVLALEELDVVEDLVAALVAQVVEQARDPLLEQIVHRFTVLPPPPRAWRPARRPASRGTGCGPP